MKVRIGGSRLGKKGECCSKKECRHSLEGRAIYEWNWFIEDADSSFDGEEHRVILCGQCYETLEKQFVKHVISSNEVDQFLAYGGRIEEMDDRDRERLHPDKYPTVPA